MAVGILLIVAFQVSRAVQQSDPAQETLVGQADAGAATLPASTIPPSTTTTMDPAASALLAQLAEPACSQMAGRTHDELAGILDTAIAESGDPLATSLSGSQLYEAMRKICPVLIDLPSDTWYRSTGISPIDDSATLRFTVEGDLPIEGWLSSEIPRLTIRCVQNKTAVFVTTNLSANPELGRYNEYSVTLRFDSNEAFYVLASESTDGNALFLPEPISLIRQMAEHDRLLFAFTPFNANPGYSTFELAAALSHMEELSELCNW